MKHPIYAVHPAVAYQQSIVQNLTAKTGKSLTDWVELAEKHDPDPKVQMTFLRSEGLGGTTARIVLQASKGGHQLEDESAYLHSAPKLVEAMYSGKKQDLIPLYSAIIRWTENHKDIRICPCKTMVPLYRNHVFAEIKPATMKRIDLGLALKGCQRPLSSRLIDTGGLQKKDRITHRFALTEMGKIDDEVFSWLEEAYNLDQ